MTETSLITSKIHSAIASIAASIIISRYKDFQDRHHHALQLTLRCPFHRSG